MKTEKQKCDNCKIISNKRDDIVSLCVKCEAESNRWFEVECYQLEGELRLRDKAINILVASMCCSILFNVLFASILMIKGSPIF